MADTGSAAPAVVAETVAFGDVSLFVRRCGDPDAPVLLGVHGGPGWDHAYLLPALDDLADLRQVVLFDLRGCGRSSRDLPDEAYQPDFCVQDIARLVEWLGQDSVDLLGFSYGGQLAMRVADEHPGLIDRLVLASTTAYSNVDEYLASDDEYRRRTALVAADAAANWRDESIDEDEKTRRDALLRAAMYVDDLTRLDQWRAVLSRVRFSGSWNGNWRRGVLRSPRPADPEDTLRRLGRPTLILHGRRDLVFPLPVARLLHAAVPASELALVDGGHAAHFDSRRDWVDRLRQFLANP